MSYKILNISDGQLVNSLASGETLRLDMREDKTIADSDITDYLRHLESVGRVKITKIEDEQVEESATKKTSKKSQKDKED